MYLLQIIEKNGGLTGGEFVLSRRRFVFRTDSGAGDRKPCGEAPAHEMQKFINYVYIR